MRAKPLLRTLDIGMFSALVLSPDLLLDVVQRQCACIAELGVCASKLQRQLQAP